MCHYTLSFAYLLTAYCPSNPIWLYLYKRRLRPKDDTQIQEKQGRLLTGRVEASKLAGAASIGVKGANGALKVFGGSPGGGAGFIVLTLGL